MSTDGQTQRTLPRHEFVAGRVSLDFCNTLSRSRQDADWDRALTPRDFLEWAQRCGIGFEQAPNGPELARLHTLRGVLARIFDAIADGRAPGPRDLAVLNAELADARAAERLVPTDRGFLLADGGASAVDRFRHAITCEAAELLTGDLRRIKRCPDHDCLWLFYDGSKNLSRRWCSMDDCGTKDKVRRFRQREAES